MPLGDQIITLFAATQGYLDDIGVEKINDFDKGLREFVKEKYPDIPHDIETKKVLTDDMGENLHEAVKGFKKNFLEVKEEG